MVKITIKIDGKLNRAYIPKELLEELGAGEWDVLSNAKAGLFFPAKTNLEDVLKSGRLILNDIKHRVELEHKKAKDASK